MIFFRKNRIFVLLFIFYLLARLINLKSLPVFNDEATYIDWAWRMINIKNQLYYSVAHAKPPLFMWIVGLVRKIIADPLMAGRIVAILGGAFSAVGIYKLAKYLFNKKVAYLSLFLYSIFPIFLFYDRQALMESSVGASGVWSIYFFLNLIKSEKYKYAVLLGMTVGLGYLVKTNAFLFFIPLIVFYIFTIVRGKKKKDLKIANLIIIVSALLLTTAPLLLNSLFWNTLANNKDYIFTLSELMEFPIGTWLKNFKDFLIIILIYLNPFTLIFCLISFYRVFKDKNESPKYTVIYLLTGWVFLIILGRNVIPRHVVSFLPIALILAASTIFELFSKTKTSVFVALTVISVSAIILSTLLVFSPIKYFDLLDKLSPFSLKEEYISHWSSGFGVNEMVSYLKDVSQNSPIIVGVRLDAGIPENAVFMYFQGSKNVIPIYLDSRMIVSFENYDCLNSKLPVYFVSRDVQLEGLNMHLEEIKKIYKPEGKNYIGIHKVKTDCVGKNTLNLY